MLLEAKGILQMLVDVAADHAKAKENFMEAEFHPVGRRILLLGGVPA